jgi:hypothetical protein
MPPPMMLLTLLRHYAEAADAIAAIAAADAISAPSFSFFLMMFTPRHIAFMPPLRH